MHEPRPLWWHVARAAGAGIPVGLTGLTLYRGPATYLGLLAFPLMSFGVQTATWDRSLTKRSATTLAAGVLILALSFRMAAG